MTDVNQHELDAAIDRALEAAHLRPGDSLGATASVVVDVDPAAVEGADAAASADTD